MSSVEFEPTIPVFERTKAVHALDRAATVIDNHWSPESEMRYADTLYTWLKILLNTTFVNN
jgi:hypothetical protein